jgi:E3 SUMO-protein ligase NSE2
MATTFAAQPLAAPLNDEALRALRELVPERDQRALPATERGRHLPSKRYTESRDLLRNAAELLASSTGDINDRAYTQKTKYLKRKVRKEKERAENPAEPEDEDTAAAEAAADARYEEFQRKTEELTRLMDTSIRGVIDDLNLLEGYPDTVKNVAEKVFDAAALQRRRFEAAHAEPHRRRGHQSRTSEEGDEQMDDEEEEPEERASSRSQRPPLDESETPHNQFSQAVADQKYRWDSQTLTERYAHDNYYKGWKAALWDAQNPGDQPPPMPHESMWFASEEGRAARAGILSTQQGRSRTGADPSCTEPGDDSESDIEISAANVHLKCPLTLLPFKIPMTSRKCNHSYEKDAILQMLAKSPVPLSAAQEGELRNMRDRGRREARRAEMLAQQPRRVRCPDAGCSMDINGEEDLYENQLLKRRVARYMARQAQDAAATSDVDDDEEDEEVDVIRGTQRKPVGLGSSPVPASTGKSRRIKNERLSMLRGRDSVVPDSQTGEDSMRQDTQIVDVDDD